MSDKELHKLLENLGDVTVKLPQHEQLLKTQLLEQHASQQSSQQTSLSAFANFFKGTIQVKHMTFAKPVVIVSGLLAMTLLGGTSYALLGGWPGVSTLLGGQTDLENGNHIVKVSTKNCVPEYINPTAKKSSDGTMDYYYEVNQDSKLTNDQVKQLVQGNCELSQQTQHEQTTVKAAIESNPANKDRLVYGWYVDSVVKSFNNDGLTIASTIPMGDPSHAGVLNRTLVQTWPHIDPAASVYYGEQKLSLSDVKPGDHISIKYRANDPNAKSTDSDIMGPTINTNNYTVMYITKNLPNVSAAVDFEKYNGTEFKQVFPCNLHPNGFCSMQEHYQEK